MKNEVLRVVQEACHSNGDSTFPRNVCSYQSARRHIPGDFHDMPFDDTDRILCWLICRTKRLVPQFLSPVLFSTGL
jgi:hypothetical protein